MKAIGMDPGSRSIDICGLCDGKICYEKVIDTWEAARDPSKVLEALKGAGSADIIAAPSGYGVEPIKLADIPLEYFEDFYYTFILATTKEDIDAAISKGVIGANIYHAMAQISKEMRRAGMPAIFIPGVINLPTIPASRKINKVDMGTADKLAVVALGVHEEAEEYGIPYSEVDYIHVEMGFGYNAVIGVKGGKVVSGIGGTLMPGPAFLTSGALDLEVAQAVSRMDKSDVFTSGCINFVGEADLDKWINEINSGGLAGMCFEAMIESVAQAIYSTLYYVRKPREFLLSGRLARYPAVVNALEERVGDIAPIRRVRGLGAREVKETAQGYAVVASGLAGGPFRDLVEHMGISSAAGTSLDYILLPRFFQSPLGRKYVELRKLIKSPALNLLWRWA